MITRAQRLRDMASQCRSLASIAKRPEIREELLEAADVFDRLARRDGNVATMDWRLKGQWVRTCNCAFGCPCHFTARPTYGVCHSLAAMRIEDGHFGKVKLDGLNWIIVMDFPGPEHDGNGKFQAIVDERATAEQREALISIISGQHSEPGTIFNILSLLVSKVHDPIFVPMQFSFDLRKRRAHVSANGTLMTEVEPVRNPVTGVERRIRVTKPEDLAAWGGEVAVARIESTGALKFVVTHGHGSLALVEHTPRRDIVLV